MANHPYKSSKTDKVEKKAEERLARPDGRRHHHVPQFLMRRFATERKPGKFQTQAFDKEKGTVFTAALENIMVGQDFNAVERDGKRISFEPVIGTIEADAATIIAAILKDGHLQGLSNKDKTVLCVFAALQFLRGPATRNLFADLAEGLLAKATAIFGEEAVSEGIPTDEESKIAGLGMIYDSLGDTADRFADKNLFLMKAAEGHPFLLGDTPITMMNDEKFGPYGNIGLSVPGIQIHLPLSPDFCLGFWCPSVLQRVRAAVDRQNALSKRLKALAVISRPDIARTILDQLSPAESSATRLTTFLAPFVAGTAVPATADNVTRQNALQVEYAQRWIISRTGDFDLARRMIADNPKYRERIKPKF